MKINLDIGHSPQDGGAASILHKTSEYSFWRDHHHHLKTALESAGHEVIVTNRSVYGRGSLDAARASNTVKPDLILSLHLNAYNGKAQGCEVLYWHKNKTIAKLADQLSLALSLVLNNPNRGAKPKKTEDRGGTQIAHSIASCLILEPCFIDNPDDFVRLQNHIAAFGATVAHVIDSFFGAELTTTKTPAAEPQKPKKTKTKQ